MQQRLTSSPPIFVHTEPGSTNIKSLQSVISNSMLDWGTKRDVVVHIIMLRSVGVCKHISTDNHADDNGCCCNVLWLRSWSTMHHGKWQSYVFLLKIIHLNNHHQYTADPVWFSLLEKDAVFWGEVHWRPSQEGWPSQWHFLIKFGDFFLSKLPETLTTTTQQKKVTKTWWVIAVSSKSCHIITFSKQQEPSGPLYRGQVSFPWGCEEESVELHFFSSYKMLKTRPATTLVSGRVL